MAFTCDDCHRKSTGQGIRDRHFSFSGGRCEGCGEAAVCADCHCEPVAVPVPVTQGRIDDPTFDVRAWVDAELLQRMKNTPLSM
jgi:hypothetical protein